MLYRFILLMRHSGMEMKQLHGCFNFGVKIALIFQNLVFPKLKFKGQGIIITLFKK